jgi:hypothetical protein
MSRHRAKQSQVAVSHFGADSSTSPKAGCRRTAKIDFAEALDQREAFLARLAQMSAEERLRAARFGGFSSWQRALWTAWFPDEVPLVNGEYEWIAMSLADLD